MSGASITPELRAEMRERVIRYEQELRSDQSFCQPSQIIDRDAVPVKLGDYTEEQIDLIIRIERSLDHGKPGETEDERLARALQRYILGGI
ncbi:hypothetical protein IPH19_05385 [Candidatus Uhrbacteria bacterium]|nr:MAG: hypothetical protein IPH19_05385 [Candidatus Uhrbacteria bacterium]